MAPATLRRHLACLVDAGLIIRRDSPNGKRFARRGQGGAIEDAFGFDLTPLVARAAEIENLAEEVRAENRATALLREKDHADAARHRQDDRDRHRGGRSGRLGRLSPALCDALRPLRAQSFALRSGGFGERIAGLAAEIRKLLESHVKPQNMSANESQSERHIQNQTTNIFELNLAFKKAGANCPISTTRNPGLHQRQSPRTW